MVQPPSSTLVEATPRPASQAVAKATAKPTPFRIAPRLSTPQTAYLVLSLVAGVSGGRILIGPQGDIPCGDWKMIATVKGSTIDVRSFRGPPKDAACYGPAKAAWKPIVVPAGSSRLVVKYRSVSTTFTVSVKGRDVRVSRISGGGVGLVGAGRWWVLPSDFLYARARDGRHAPGSAQRACARISEVVRHRGGQPFDPPDGLPIPRLASTSQAPGLRAEMARTMLATTPSHGCSGTYLVNASEAELQAIASDARCEGAVVGLVRDVPDGTPVTSDPDKQEPCARTEPEPEDESGLG